MKNTPYLLTLAAVASFSLPAFAQSAPQGLIVTTQGPGQVSAAEAIELQGTIIALDKQNRTATIKGGGGNEVFLFLGDDVKNIDQIKVGDMVALRYGHALALELRKAKNKVTPMREDSFEAVAAEPGKKPAGAAAMTIRFVADVTAVNAKTQTITLKGVKRTVELKVNDPAQFKLIKVGDQVEGTYSEAVAIAVTPQPKK